MSASKRRKTGEHAGVAGRSSDAAAAPPAAASAASIASVRRIVGSRRELPTVSAADRNDDADGAVDFVSSSDVLLAVDDDDWTYPDPSTYLPTLHTHYQFHLEPTSHPVFGKYKQTDLDSIVGEVMKFVMLRENTGMMVTHKEILTLLQDRCKSGATYIIADARRRFMELYGYELHEVSKSDAPSGDSKKRKSVATSNSATKAYILRTPNFPSVGLRRAWNTDLALKADNESVARRGLLFWLYAFIHAEESSQTRGATIADGVTGVEEKKLWSQMKSTLKLDRDMKYHSVFGNVSNLIDEFVKQQYLVKLKIHVDGGGGGGDGGGSRDSTSFTYRIGHRGHAEITDTSIYRGMCEHIFGCEPNAAHLNQIQRNEELAKGQGKMQTTTQPAEAQR